MQINVTVVCSLSNNVLMFVFQAALSLLMLRNPIFPKSHHLANYHYSGNSYKKQHLCRSDGQRVSQTINHFKCQLLICEDLRAGSVFWLHSCGALQRSTAEKLRQIFFFKSGQTSRCSRQTDDQIGQTSHSRPETETV